MKTYFCHIYSYHHCYFRLCVIIMFHWNSPTHLFSADRNQCRCL